MKNKTKYVPKEMGYVRVSKFNYSKEDYTRLYLYLYGKILKDYHCRKDTIHFIMKDVNTKKDVKVKMKLRMAIGNLIFWKANVDFGEEITTEFLYDTGKFSENHFNNHMKWLYKRFYKKVTIDELAECISYILESYSTIPIHFCNKIGNNIGLRDIIELMDKYKEVDDIVHTEYPDGTPFSFVETDISERNKNLANYMKNDKKSNFRAYITAGGNINMGQMAQMLVCIGPRVDIDGSVPPVLVNTNFVRGLRNPSDYYLESFTCKKSLIANNYQMSSSGYTGRIIDINNADVCLDSNIEDCGCKNTIKIFIKDKKYLEMIDWKNIKIGEKNRKPIWYMVDVDKDNHLIGKTVEMRSAITCNAETGHICKACYGGIEYSIKGYHSSLLSSHELSEPVGQKVLSTKHLIKSKVIEIVYNTEFENFFACETESIHVKDEYLKANTFELGFQIDDIEEYIDAIKNNEEDANTLSGFVSQLIIRVDGIETPIENVGADLYFTPELSSLLAKQKLDDLETDVVYINIKPLIEEDTDIFFVNIQNMEIGVFLEKIMRFLGIRNIAMHNTIEEYLEELISMIMEIDLSINIVHLESIMYNLIRDENMLINRPDFSKNDVKYKILPICRANTFSRALTTSLAYERIPAQYRNVLTYHKNSKGLFDVFFK